MYPTTIGTHYMRCKGVPPAYVKCFTEYLRAAGYYCTNDSKTDYNFDAPLTAWDDSRGGAHWRNRPTKETPFFCRHQPDARRTRARFACRRRSSRARRKTLAAARAARSGQGPAAAVLSRHADRPPRHGQLLRQPHVHRQAGRRDPQDSWTTTAWPRARSSSSGATTAADCRGTSGGFMTRASTCRSSSAGRASCSPGA